MGILDKFKKSTPSAAPSLEQRPEEIKAEVVEASVDVNEPKRGFFARIKQGLGKTKQLLRTDIRDIFKGEGRLVDDAFLEELRVKLVRTDMGPQAANRIV